MPKWKQVGKKIDKAFDKEIDKASEKLDQALSDKYERAENCFDKIREAGVKICSKNTGQEIVSYEQIKDLTIGNIDLLNHEMLSYCLDKFNNQGIIKCDSPAITEKTEPVASSSEGISEQILHDDI